MQGASSTARDSSISRLAASTAVEGRVCTDAADRCSDPAKLAKPSTKNVIHALFCLYCVDDLTSGLRRRGRQLHIVLRYTSARHFVLPAAESL
jgi:hypothetical protein